MAKLPATSYVRMVDIWLIFVQLYPFIEAKNINIQYCIFVKITASNIQVVLYTIIENYNEEEFTNNHGLIKVVPEDQIGTKVSSTYQ